MIDPNAIAEAKYDTYDQQGLWNAAEMRAMSGLEALAPEDISAEAILARIGGNVITSGDATTEDDPDTQRRQEIAPIIGSVMCGDCAVDVSPGKTCFGGHLTVKKNGKRVING